MTGAGADPNGPPAGVSATELGSPAFLRGMMLDLYAAPAARGTP